MLAYFDDLDERIRIERMQEDGGQGYSGSLSEEHQQGQEGQAEGEGMSGVESEQGEGDQGLHDDEDEQQYAGSSDNDDGDDEIDMGPATVMALELYAALSGMHVVGSRFPRPRAQQHLPALLPGWVDTGHRTRTGKPIFEGACAGCGQHTTVPFQPRVSSGTPPCCRACLGGSQ